MTCEGMEATEGQRAAALPCAAKGTSLQGAVCPPRSRGDGKGGGEGVGMGWEAGSRARPAELSVRREGRVLAQHGRVTPDTGTSAL